MAEQPVRIDRFRKALDVALTSDQPITVNQLDSLQAFILLNLNHPSLSQYKDSCQDRLDLLRVKRERQQDRLLEAANAELMTLFQKADEIMAKDLYN